MKTIKKLATSIALALVLTISAPTLLPAVTTTVEAATIKINKKAVSLLVDESYTLKITGTKKKVTWTSSNSAVASVNSKGKVTAKSGGKATITANVNKKNYKCVVTTNYKYGDGKYLVGKDIPAGEYVIFATTTYSAYLSLTTEENRILYNSLFTNNSIVTISEGEYLTIERGYAVPIDEAKITKTNRGGMYEVGRHVEAGEYIIKPRYSCYVQIYSASPHSGRNIYTTKSSSKEFSITVENGQYVEISGSDTTFSKVKK